MNIKNSNTFLKNFIFFPLLLYFGKRSLVAYDEGFYVVQARWILDKANWVAPIWWDSVNIDRTNSIQILLALSRSLFGESLFIFYLPTLIASIFMILFTYQLHKELISNKNPIYSAIILTTTLLWITYANMATQDIIFASIITFGILNTIRAYTKNKKYNLLASGMWVGFAFMFKTYLTVIPFCAILPFLYKSRIILRKYFWIGLFIGFFPFILWSYICITTYNFESYMGIYRKLITLSGNNNFTNPPYYYLWNLTINIFPWSLLSLLGFLKAYKLNSLSRYFLFFYPVFIIILLSLFSTKTPYYPLQIFSLISINSYLGIKYLVEKKGTDKLLNFEKINYIFIPFVLIIGVIILNFSNLVSFDLRGKIFISIGISLFSISWISFIFAKNNKRKFILTLLGPYLLMIFLVQSGLITDKSKSLRIASEDLIKSEKLFSSSLKIVKSDIKDDLSQSKIIKIMTLMPKIGKGIDKLEEMEPYSYAWTTLSKYEIEKSQKYLIINDREEFYPWKLIFKR